MKRDHAGRTGAPLRQARLASFAALGLLLAACGDAPAPSKQPTPTPVTYPIEAYVFYDEDGDLALDVSELARVPGVDVTVGGQTARSEIRTGRARIESVPEGQHAAEARHLPPYYAQRVTPRVSVPTSDPLPVPLALDIGSNRPNVYMAFGDSITEGMGASDGLGYRKKLEQGLVDCFGVGTVENAGVSGTRTGRGLERIGSALAEYRPAYSLILYGTNDWNDAACKNNVNCPTVENLRSIIRNVRAAGSLPVLCTIIPANPARNPASRNTWVEETNKSLRLMAENESVVVADLYAALLAKGDLVSLFFDHVHPNDAGYQIIATELLRTLTGETTASASPRADTSAALGQGAPDAVAAAEPEPAATRDDGRGREW